MQLDLYRNLLMRYANQIYLIDDYETKGVILCNETREKVMTLFYKFKYHNISLVEKKTEIINSPILKFPSIFENSDNIDELPKAIGWRKITINRDVYKIDIIEFVKFALIRGYDWKLYGEPEWNEIRPKKKKKLIKPKKR